MYLIIFDLDDTLLKNDRTISTFTIDILAKIQKLGHLIAINTSRSYQNSMTVINLIHPDFGIYNGGATIVNKQGQIISEVIIPRDITKAFSREIVPHVASLSIQTRDYFYTNNPCYTKQNAIYLSMDDGYDGDCYKLMTKSSNLSYLEEMAKKYQLTFQNYLGGPFSRFGPKNATKEIGNLKLKEYLNIPDLKTIVFGDDVGDLKMLLDADIGVAMANSKPSVLENIKIHTLSNEEDGVACFLKNYFQL